jgi:hypothetical protein
MDKESVGACLRAASTTVAVLVVMLLSPAQALATPLTITSFSTSPAEAPAGSHPTSTVSMNFGGTDDVKDIIQHYPPGIIPNPEVIPKCSQTDFFVNKTCPANTQLGTTTLTAASDALPGFPITLTDGKVYNLEVSPPWAGGLGFIIAGNTLAAPFTVRSAPFGTITDWRGDPGLSNPPGLTTSFPNVKPDITVQPTPLSARDYGLTGLSLNVPKDLDLGGGVDAIKIQQITYTLCGMRWDAGLTSCSSAPVATPYLTTTTACVRGYARLEATSWQQPTTKYQSAAPGWELRGKNAVEPPTTPCTESELPYDPTLDIFKSPLHALETLATDMPSRYDISINVPAGENNGSGNDRHEPYLKRGSITLPEGTRLSPPAAQGLEGCTDAQIGIGNRNTPACPAGSDIGDVTVVSKNVPAPLVGDFYLGEPTPGHTYRVFIAFEIVDGLWVKLDGESFPDEATGQITTVFDDLPMLPFEKFTITLEGGDRAVLVNPPDCGQHTLTSTLTPWSGAITFPSSMDELPFKSFTTSYDGAGAACPDPFPFNPAVAGSTNPLRAGATSTLSLSLSSPDRDQLLKTLKTSLPPGLTGALPGIPLCSLNDAGGGTCGEASRIGSVSTAVGSGNDPLPLPGTIYLAESLQPGDPASLSIVVPAKAGPFDFGNVVIRARIVLRSDFGLDVVLVDDLPRIIEGIPIRLRTTDVEIDRSNFMRNPTSCAQLQLGATFTSREGTQASATSPYQATNCGALPFSPELRFEVSGETKKNGHPTLKALLTQPPGQANIAKSRVVLPDVIRPETAALFRPGGLCQEAQLATRSCPANSKVGSAKATTPLLPGSLSGPVYIVQHSGNPLPKLAIFLDGRVSIKLEAQNELAGLKIVNRFDNLPDLPVSSFELTINGGANGVLKNYGDLCDRVRGEATFTAYSGKTASDKPLVEVPACGIVKGAPRVSASLRGVAGGKPSLKLRARRATDGANLRTLSMKLPRSLRPNSKKARRGLVVKTSRKLKRSQWRLSRKGVLTIRRLPKRGVRSITATLRAGTIKPSAALRRKVRKGRRTTLSFKVKLTDVQRRSFTVPVKTRAR